jgi:hypothetical protein
VNERQFYLLATPARAFHSDRPVFSAVYDDDKISGREYVGQIALRDVDPARWKQHPLFEVSPPAPPIHASSSGDSAGSPSNGSLSPRASLSMALARNSLSAVNSVGADPNLSHRADRILSQGWGPAFRGPAVDKCRSVLAL